MEFADRPTIPGFRDITSDKPGGAQVFIGGRFPAAAWRSWPVQEVEIDHANRVTLFALDRVPFMVNRRMADDPDSVKHWLPICKTLISTGNSDIKGAYLAGECLGMIEATTFFVQEVLPGGIPFRACLPDDGIPTRQLVTTVLQWIEQEIEGPEDVNFMVAIQMALRVTWPCHDAPKKK